ncbi:GNAT family protein [Lapillicoccus sp.]|uniref:GNAT family N-acetyltransferase n=1 Tax=Lapillicoccus sp. TaxID=1909287 RepID=UPI0025D6E7FA|nr:GNAT family protein [Lapillicoccus sp.]
MSGPVPPLRADGERIWVATPTAADIPAYQLAVERSRTRLGAWNPVDPLALPAIIRAQGQGQRTLLVHARDREGAHGIVGKINVNNIVRGRAQSGTVGYDSYDPYVGRGLFTEGLRLVVDLAFRAEPEGLGLHRLAANVQPGNVRSAAVLRRLGFNHEGQSPGYLLLADATGEERWRLHDRYAVLAGEWPAAPYLRRHPRRLAVVVNGLPGAGKSTLAAALAAELGLPLLSKDVVKESVADVLGVGPAERERVPGTELGMAASEAIWSLLAGSPVGAVVESFFLAGRDDASVRAGMQRAHLDPGSVPEVWCDLPAELARARFEDRSRRGERHGIHGTGGDQHARWDAWERQARPLGWGPVLRCDTSRLVAPRVVTALALSVRAASR